MTAPNLREALRRVPTAVTIVTTSVDGTLKGFTANAFASVSLDPPTVLVCVNRGSRSHPLIARAGRFCVNVLRLDQRALAERFAVSGAGDPFRETAYRIGATGAPVFADALAAIDCELAEEHLAGTHAVLIGRVVATAVNDGAPLGYFDGAYRDFGCAT